MSNANHYGSGKFGYKVVWKNGLVAFSWFETKEKRDEAFKQSKSKDANKKSITKTSR